MALGERSGLWREYARIIGEVRPSWVVIENVSALMSRGFEIVAADLCRLGMDFCWDCIPAASVGAPPRRDRVFILAWRRDVCSPALRASESAFADAIRIVRERPFPWPAPPGLPQYEFEPPRVAAGVPHRAHRLRALGNAVLPPVAEAVGHALRLLPLVPHSDVPGAQLARLTGTTFLGPQRDMFARSEFTDWPRAGTIRDGIVYGLRPAAPLNALYAGGSKWESGDEWATPRAAVNTKSEKAMRPFAEGGASSPPGLAQQVGLAPGMWGTPTVSMETAADMEQARYSSGRRPKYAEALERSAAWATPRASESENRQTRPTPSQRAGKHGLNLATQATWATPTGRDGTSGPGHSEASEGSPNLRTQIRWPTPVRTDAAAAARHTTTTGVSHPGTTLTDAIRLWPTPVHTEARQGFQDRSRGMKGSEESLSTMAMKPNGGAHTDPLNAAWVETLMGLPVGWTEVEFTATRKRKAKAS